MLTMPARRTGPSLEHTLPLFLGGLLLILMAGYTLASYREVRRSAETTAIERLRRLTRQLIVSSQPTITQRIAMTRRVAADPRIARFFASSDPATAGPAQAALRELIGPTDTAATAELWSASGQRLLAVDSAPPAPAIGAPVAEVLATITGDSVDYSETASIGDSVFFWMTTPVSRDGRPVGYLVQRRRIARNPRIEETIRELTGSEAVVYYLDGKRWIRAGGFVGETPANVRNAGDHLVYERGDRGFIAASDTLPGIGWQILSEAPLSSVLARPQAHLRRSSLIALLFILAGTLIAWLFSRRITKPLAEVARAAESFASGEFSTRVQVSRRDEVGRVGSAFNAMAEQLQNQRTELELQVEQSGSLAAELEVASRAKSDFLAVMSHELRTPLNAIRGYVDILDMELRGPVTEDQRRDLTRIRHNQEHLLRIIGNILDYTRMDARPDHFEPRRVPLGPTVREVESYIRPQVEAKELRYEFAACPDDIIAMADVARIQQIVLNLLSNAVKFTPPGGRITVACAKAGNTVRVMVTDTGIGIPANMHETIFQPFVQAHGGLTRPADGTGLGLTISRQLAREMNGELTVDSDTGRGSTFTLILPAGR